MKKGDEHTDSSERLRIRLHEGDSDTVTQFTMDCVLDFDWEQSPIGIELISPRAIADAHGIAFDGDGTATNAMERTSYDADADAMYVHVGAGRSHDSRAEAATVFLSPSGQVLELIVRLSTPCFPVTNATKSEPGQPDPRWALLLAGLPDVDEEAGPNLPEAAASSWYVTDLANVRTADELVALIRVDFSVPGPMGGLDAVLSRLSDIDWAPNPAGYVWQIRGLPALRANNPRLFKQMVGVWVHLCDRGRSTLVPFRILLHGDKTTLDDLKVEIAREYQAFRDSPWKVDFEEPAVLEWVDGGWRSAVLPE